MGTEQTPVNHRESTEQDHLQTEEQLQRQTAEIVPPPHYLTCYLHCVSGILPVYHNLFSLASEDFTFWFHPNYIFNTEETEDLLVHYRVRFFFQNWYGKDNRRSHRYSLSKSRLGAVLDCNVINYLFAQSRSDFIHGHPEVCPSLKMHDECLGMAILDMLRIAKESKQNLQDVCREISYKSCLPESHRHEIQKQHALARYRIRKTLKRYLRQLSNCQADELSLKLKYLLDLETVTPSFGTEQFQVWNPNSIHQGDNVALQLIQVSGESGIQYRSTDASEWQTFCDFQEIIDISIKQAGRDRLTLESRVVTVTRQDSRFLEAEFQTLKEALSFVSLIDGYFRLIMDSLHYFCEEVAPPTILEDLENCCHGPITSEFAINKLKRAGAKAGMFLIRRSPKEFNDYFITICVKTPHGIEYKDCLLRKDCSFHLFGVTRNFNNLKELILYYQNNGLTIAGLPVDLKTWCSPQPKELTNLIVVRSNCSLEAPASPSLPCRQPINVQFQMVKKEDLRWGENLGQGSFTKIFQGCKMDNRDGEVHETEVLLKVLDTPHKSCWESFFEAASVMSQLSHKHLILVYGICIHGSENVMVQEYVKYGALDLFLKRNRSTVQVRWKLDVARQLACALNYLVRATCPKMAVGEFQQVSFPLPKGNLAKAHCLMVGMEYLQTMRYVHRDLAARNVLVASDTLVKIADFGLTKVLPIDKDYYRVQHPGESPIFWYSPESIAECRFSPKSDVWSFGIVLHELFSFCERRRSPKQVSEIEGSFPEILPFFSFFNPSSSLFLLFQLYLQQIGSDRVGFIISVHLLQLFESNWRLPAPSLHLPEVCIFFLVQ
uniref:Tyrosine-protein kinase n=1 Tax=Erpetoichthys calabaricus TaxID=27687 RepID=A0A8C4TGU0_ERPCA